MAAPLPNLREDVVGQSPPDVSGKLEESAFNEAAAKHSLKFRRLEIGLFGLLGSQENAPNHIAFLSMVAGMVMAAGCLVASFYTKNDEAKFFQSFSERSLAFSAVCISYIFGRSSAKS